MNLRGVATAAVAGAGAGAALVRKVVAHAPSGWGAVGGAGHDDPGRWRAVTVNRPLGELQDVPAPLADLGDAVEVRLQPAPGDKGTEIHARLTAAAGDTIDGQEPLQALRSALRQAKQVAEVGYVLEADQHTTAKPTPLNEPLRQATRRAGGEGRL